ncbi:unnamed protein product [Calypogeia fissa]
MNALSDEEHALPGPSDQCSPQDVSIESQRQRFKNAVLAVQAANRFVHSPRLPRCRVPLPQDYLWYEDPITCDTMCDPVKCYDGRTYDRWTVIDNGLTKSPFTRRPFSIAVDDMDVRSLLFSSFPEQETQFVCKRTNYRAKALQHLRYHPLEVKVAVQMLKNVLQWAPEDTECRNELNVILSSITSQSGQFSSTLPQGSDSQGHDVNQVPATMEGSQDNPNAIRRRRLSQETNSEPHSRSERSQTYVIPVISHDDLIRERYGDGRLRAVLLFVFFMVMCFILFESQIALQSTA